MQVAVTRSSDNGTLISVAFGCPWYVSILGDINVYFNGENDAIG